MKSPPVQWERLLTQIHSPNSDHSQALRLCQEQAGWLWKFHLSSFILHARNLDINLEICCCDTTSPSERREAEEMNFVSFYSSPEMVKEEESVKPARKLQPPEILVQIDVAEAAGLMTTNNIKLRPSWCSQDFCKEIRSSQVCQLSLRCLFSLCTSPLFAVLLALQLTSCLSILSCPSHLSFWTAREWRQSYRIPVQKTSNEANLHECMMKSSPLRQDLAEQAKGRIESKSKSNMTKCTRNSHRNRT